MWTILKISMRIRNVHQRRLTAALASAGSLLDTLSGPKDKLWPRDRWPAMQFGGPIRVGAKGGHGPVRYEVAEYVPGQRVVFRFDSTHGLMRGFTGHHWFEVLEESPGIIFRHVIEAEGAFGPFLRWFFLVRPLHNALLEDAIDQAELALTGHVRCPARWNQYVRLLRWGIRRRTNQGKLLDEHKR